MNSQKMDTQTCRLLLIENKADLDIKDVSIRDDGKILWNSSKYITPCEDIVKLANSFIRQKSDILSNSMLSNAAQAILLRS